jgi:apolipoprotein N-acyltransferase
MIHSLIEQARLAAPDAIVLPEDSRYFTEFYHARASGITRAFEAFVLVNPTSTTKIIDSSRFEDNDVVFESSFVLDARAPSVVQSGKSYLVPQGEYMPYLTSALLQLMGQGTIAAGLTNYFSYTPHPIVPTNKTIPVLFCFESVKPWQAKQIVGDETVFVAHPMSHAKFHTPYTLWHQLDTMLRVQAVYAQVPIVSAGNMVTGKAYLPDGTIDNGQVIYEDDGHYVTIVSWGAQ